MLRCVNLLISVVIFMAGCSYDTEPAASRPPTGSLKIDSPAQGSVFDTPTIEVSGRAPAGSRIVRDISWAADQDVIAGVDGTWTMIVELEEGANELVFRIGDERSTEKRLGVTYAAAVAKPDPTQDSATPPIDSPTNAPAVTASASPTKSYATFGDGIHEVGRDIKPGTYRLRERATFCYWARLKGFDGTLDEILANDNVIDAYAVVTIRKSDAGFESRNCGDWTADLSRVTESKSAMEFDGTYIVKTDISAGKWRSSGGDFCYWARLKGFDGTLNHIIANDNVFGGRAVVTIKSTDKGFITRGCGTWTRS